MNKYIILIAVLLISALVSASPIPDPPSATHTHDHAHGDDHVGHDAKEDHKHGDHTHHPGHDHVHDHEHGASSTAAPAALMSSQLTADESSNQVVTRELVREEESLDDSGSNKSMMKLMTHIVRSDFS
jgi:ABC-type Zn2+ transport system substrate-binding protein/surface adhesin